MKTIYNRWLPLRGFTAINLFGILLVRNECKGDLDAELRNHEAIHTAQMKELLWVGFYVWYVVEWMVLLAKFRNRLLAYRHIRFEREAYGHEREADYLSRRKHFCYL